MAVTTNRVTLPKDEWVQLTSGLANVLVENPEAYTVELIVAAAKPATDAVGHPLDSHVQNNTMQFTGLVAGDKVYARCKTKNVAVIVTA